MMIDDTTQAGGENIQDAGAESTPQANADIEFLKNQNAELNSKLNSLLDAQKKPEPVKPLTKEQYAQLMKDDPEGAIAYTVSGQVSARAAQIESSLAIKQSQMQFDEKANQDFPLIKTDKQFQRLVQSEIQSLIEGGMSKDSPKLVYKAAEYAALKYDKTKGTKTSSGAGGMSGEAPSNIQREGNAVSKNLPKNFDKMATMFNLSDKAKARAKENFDYRAKQEEARKNRG